LVQIILDSSSFLSSSLRYFFLQLLGSLFLLRRVRLSLALVLSLRFISISYSLSVSLSLCNNVLLFLIRLSPFLSLSLSPCQREISLFLLFPPFHGSFSFPLSLSRSLSCARLKDDLVTSLYYSNTSVNILCTGGALCREKRV